MFSGTTLGKTISSTARHTLVAYGTPCELLLKPLAKSPYRLKLTRSQPFTGQEKNLVTIFVEELSNIAARASDELVPDLMDLVPRRLISRLLLPTRGRRTLESVIERLELLASETYEGKPVVIGLGLTGTVGRGAVRLDQLWDEDFARALSNGLDSIYMCGSDGRVFNLAVLKPAWTALYAPHRFGSIVAWTARPNRVALALNRNREILVFKDKELYFAKRQGDWKYFAHRSVVSRLGVGTKAVRQAVYQSCLDASFARTGACIGVLKARSAGRIGATVPARELIADPVQTRTKLLREAVRRPFQSLDRRLRQELLAMDGATVLKHNGEVVAAGSIVKVPGSSAGGGRRAAAVQLSRFGLGIKISSDGPITGFRLKKVIFSL
jgi:hypothetical protein